MMNNVEGGCNLQQTLRPVHSVNLCAARKIHHLLVIIIFGVHGAQ